MSSTRRNTCTRTKNPCHNDWESLHGTIPKREWHAFKDFVLEADINGTLGRIGKKYPEHPIILLVKDYLENGNRRKMILALKAVAGTDDRYLLLLDKS